MYLLLCSDKVHTRESSTCVVKYVLCIQVKIKQIHREDAMELLVVSFAIETSTSSKISVCICAGQAFFESTSF